jgi:hypothetical protein
MFAMVSDVSHTAGYLLFPRPGCQSVVIEAPDFGHPRLLGFRRLRYLPDEGITIAV